MSIKFYHDVKFSYKNAHKIAAVRSLSLIVKIINSKLIKFEKYKINNFK